MGGSSVTPSGVQKLYMTSYSQVTLGGAWETIGDIIEIETRLAKGKTKLLSPVQALCFHDFTTY